MAKIQKKYIIAGLIGILTITGAALYLQYKKLMEYCISFKGVKIVYLGIDNIIFDLYLNFLNKSAIKINIVSQEYKVYLNDKLVSTVDSDKPQVIEPKAKSVISVNVKFNPRQVLTAVNVNELLLNREKIRLKVDTKIKVALGFIKISIPYVYETTLKELTSGSGTNTSTENTKC